MTPTVRAAASPYAQRSERIVRRLVAGFLLLLALFMLVLAVVQTVRNYTDLPYWDQWASLRKLQRFVEQGPSLHYFWNQHNEHRLLVPRLLFLADAFLFRLDNVLLLTAIFTTQAAHLVLFGRIAYRRLQLRGSTLWAAVGALGVLLFSPVQDANFIWGFQIQVVGVFYFGTLAAYCMAMHISKQHDGATGAAWLAGSMTSAFAANYTWAAGLNVWPALGLVILLLRPVRRRTLITFLGVASATVVSYFWAYRVQGHFGEPQATSGYLLDLLRFVVHYLGAPVGALPAVFGTIGLSTLLGGLSFALIKRPAWSREPGAVTCLAAMSFVAGGALLTAIGRVGLGIEHALAPRYSTPALVFWSAAMLLVLGVSRSLGRSLRSRRFRSLLAALAVLATTWLGYRGLRSARYDRRSPEMLRQAEAAVLAGELGSPALQQMTPPNEKFIHQRIDFLERQGWSVFARNESQTSTKEGESGIGLSK